MRLISLVTLLFFCAAHGRPNKQDVDYDMEIALPEDGVQNDDNYYDDSDDDDNDEDLPLPVLVSKPTNFMAQENETVHLPCETENGDTPVFIWRKNNEVVFQDTIKFGSFGNNFQISNRTLIISNVGVNETANYTCTILLSKTETLNVTHELLVQTAPKIESLQVLHDNVEIDAGKSLVLTCKAIGYPRPTVVWSKKGERLAEGNTLSIENVSHHDSGDYQCLADNHIEPPAHKFIHISIAHKPVVNIEKLTVNSDEHLDSQLICYVKAVPKPEVVWKKDGVNIVRSDRKHFKHHNHTYILEIQNVKIEDFGIYTCSAYNRVGSSEKNVVLTGFPSPAEHINTFHDADKNIVVVWNVESNSPIVQYEVEYKKNSNSDWKMLHPEVSNPEGNLYTVNTTFTNLPGGHYEVKVRSKNTYGWSDYSPIIKFKNGGHHQHKPHKNVHNHEETPVVIIHEPQAFDGSGITEEGSVAQTSEQSVILQAQFPFEAQNDNTEQKQHTPEHQQQLMKESKGNGTGGVTSVLPTASLLLVTTITILFSH
ncbi:hypothetical protein RN001_015164 [Aquatica leii]|uniref:Uncharacterized protein n=1 Tax=Aquatica leii TaxID=1421715 RepID=A0AAN7SNE9_9COLE|nr:hypothetical protein RN001_015164 [Aquatica leii]